MGQFYSSSNSMNDDGNNNDNDDVNKELSDMNIDSRSEKKRGTCLYC
jgi:hypothetical protein